MASDDFGRRISAVIEKYVTASGHDCPKLGPATNLVRDTGLSSDDGVNLVLDLCTEFHVSLPEDFNAIVHDDGKRDRTFAELVTCIQEFVQQTERTK